MTRGSRSSRAALSAAALAAALLALPSSPAAAATVAPTTLADEFDTNPSACSLREAVHASNVDAAFGGCPAGSGADDIPLGAGTYQLATAATGANDNSEGELDVTAGDVLTISHSGAAPAAIDGGDLDRVAYVAAGGTLAVSGIEVRGGRATNQTAGGIASEGSLTLTNAAVVGNEIVTGGYGAGIWSFSGSLVLTNVTVSGNTTPAASAGAGGIYANGTADLTNVTVALNSAGNGSGGGILVGGSATVTLKNTILSGNTAGAGPDCSDSSTGTVVSSGRNLVADAAGCPFTPAAGDQTGVPAGLSPLADNGGPAPTHALSPGGNAVDNIPAADCAGLTADSRGYPRPFPAGGSCDAGAYELVTCSGAPVNAAGPFAGCPAEPEQPVVVPPVVLQQAQAPAKKCKKGRKLKKGKCVKRKRRNR